MNWRRFFTRAQADSEQQQEMEFHVEVTAEEYMARGMSPESARQAARRKLGNMALVREEVYRMNTINVLDSLGRDLRGAVRSMRLNTSFSLIAVLTLALGIGATTAIFSVVNGVLLRPLPYPNADRLVALIHGAPRAPTELTSAPFLHFTYVQNSRTFAATGLWQNAHAAVTGLAEPEQVNTIRVTSQILPLLGAEPLVGRVFSDLDDSPGNPLTAILAYGYWQRRFGGNGSVIGRQLTLDGQPHTIIGVMPARFRFLDQKVDVLRPLQLNRQATFLGFFAFRGIARLNPGVTLAQANSDVNRMIPIAIDAFPPFRGGSREAFRANGFRGNLRLLKDSVVGDLGNTLWALMGTIGLVLLIACANVGNLFLVRADGRRREFAVRAALGAGRTQIARELLIESLVFGLVAGAFGLGIAYGGLQLLVRIAPGGLPRRTEIGIDATTLCFALSVSLLSGLLLNLVPAVRFVGSRLADVLHGGGRSMTTGKERHQVRAALVMTQVAMALVVLIASGLMFRTFMALSNVAPGFVPGNLQTLRLTIPQTQAPRAEQAARMINQIAEQVALIPGVSKVAAGSILPLEGDWMIEEVRAEGINYSSQPTRRIKFVSPGFFEVLGTPLLAGRDFDWNDNYDRRPVAVISEKLAREEWRTPAAALGKRIQLTPNGSWKEVIGVVGDVHDEALNKPSPPIAYFPILLDRYYLPDFVARTITLAARTPRAGTQGLLGEIQRAVWSVNANLPLTEVRTMDSLYDSSVARTSFTLVMLAIAGAMALALGVVGIYGVLAYTVEQRSREVGIRIALGARPAMVTRMFVRRGLILSGAGILVGLAGATALSRLMASLLFGVTAVDPATYAITATVMLVAAAAASYVPARRAATLDPTETLRGE